MTILNKQGVLLLLPHVHHCKNIVAFDYHVSHPNMHLHTFFRKHSKTQFIKPSIFRSYSPCESKKHDCFRPSAALESLEHTVTIHRTSLIFPLEETERKTMFLSNIDKSLVNIKTTAIFFFSKNPEFSFEQIVTKLESALRKILVQYDFIAGRLRRNVEGQLEIDCNAAGVGFVVASCNSSLEELGGIASPNVTNQKFALRKWNALLPDDQPLAVVQVTLLQCGGFALGLVVNHVAIDGIAIRILLENLASLLSGNDFVIPPFSNRHLLAARSPPRVTCPHPEMFNFESLQNISNKTLLKATFQKLDSKYFQLNLSDIMNLKKKSRMSGGENSAHSTGFNVVVAHIWKCVAETKNPENDPERLSTILYAVNVRPRVKPRLPSSYAGNAIVSGYSTTSCGEIKKRPFSHLVDMVSEGDTRITDEYVRSLIDWGELYKGFPYGDAVIASWWNLGLNEIDYPWGRPKWSCPVLPNHGNSAIILIPEAEGKRFKGLHVLVSLSHKEMKIFEGLFYALL